MSTPTPRKVVLGSVAIRPADELGAPVVFRGEITATTEETPAHCSAPPLQASFRLPRLSRDVEAFTRPRTPLRATKRDASSEAGAVAEFRMDFTDEVKVKVEAEEQIKVAEDPRQLCARLSAVRIAPQARASDRPNGRGRPKGSKSKPRVEPHFDTSAPPERDEARKARAKMAPRK